MIGVLVIYFFALIFRLRKLKPQGKPISQMSAPEFFHWGSYGLIRVVWVMAFLGLLASTMGTLMPHIIAVFVVIYCPILIFLHLMIEITHRYRRLQEEQN